MSNKTERSAPTVTRPRRTRGRPSVMDKHAVAEAAFALWFERGLAATSWSDLAEVTGVSARTLIRHFPDKRDIAWLGVAPATARLRAALAQIPATADLNDALRAAIVESVSHDPRISRVNPSWLRLISTEPELSSMSAQAFRPWIDELAGFIRSRIPLAPNAVCVALGTAYQAAAFAALTEWANASPTDSPTDSPQPATHTDAADAVEAMLAWIDIRIPGL